MQEKSSHGEAESRQQVPIDSTGDSPKCPTTSSLDLQRGNFVWSRSEAASQQHSPVNFTGDSPKRPSLGLLDDLEGLDDAVQADLSFSPQNLLEIVEGGLYVRGSLASLARVDGEPSAVVRVRVTVFVHA